MPNKEPKQPTFLAVMFLPVIGFGFALFLIIMLVTHCINRLSTSEVVNIAPKWPSYVDEILIIVEGGGPCVARKVYYGPKGGNVYFVANPIDRANGRWKAKVPVGVLSIEVDVFPYGDGQARTYYAKKNKHDQFLVLAERPDL